MMENSREPVELTYASVHMPRPIPLPGDDQVVRAIKVVLSGIVLIPFLFGIVAIFLYLSGLLGSMSS